MAKNALENLKAAKAAGGKSFFVNYASAAVMLSLILLLAFFYGKYRHNNMLGGERHSLGDFLTKSFSKNGKEANSLKKRLDKIKGGISEDDYHEIRQYIDEGYIHLAKAEIEKKEEVNKCPSP